MEEAKSSINTYGLTKHGWNVQLTLRDEDEYKLLERFGKLVLKFEEIGITPKAVGQQVKSSVPGAPAVYSPAKPDEPLQSIPVEKIIFGGTGKDGKHPFWRIKGGFAKEFGITVFPEVLEAAGITGLDAMGENLAGVSLDEGLVAYFSSKPKKDDPSKTTPDKVVRIVTLGATPDDVFPREDDNDVADGTYF